MRSDDVLADLDDEDVGGELMHEEKETAEAQAKSDKRYDRMIFYIFTVVFVLALFVSYGWANLFAQAGAGGGRPPCRPFQLMLESHPVE